MSQHPQTIQIYLPKGNPRGLRIAEITTRTVRMIEIPRLLLDDFLAMSEAERVGVYFLIGSNDEDSLSRLYIGQSGDLATRLKEHHNKKDFWERAFVMVSRTNSMTQTHALFLEWLSIKAATEAARYILDNGNAGSRPHTTPPLEAECRGWCPKMYADKRRANKKQQRHGIFELCKFKLPFAVPVAVDRI